MLGKRNQGWIIRKYTAIIKLWNQLPMLKFRNASQQLRGEFVLEKLYLQFVVVISLESLIIKKGMI